MFNQERLSWSLRAGGRYNSNRDIADTLHLGLRRSNLDFKSPFLSWLDNSRVDLLTELAVDGLALVRQEVIFGKKYPMESRKLALGIRLRPDLRAREQVQRRARAARQDRCHAWSSAPTSFLTR